MPIASPEKYAEMIATAKSQGFAFPAFEVTDGRVLGLDGLGLHR